MTAITTGCFSARIWVNCSFEQGEKEREKTHKQLLKYRKQFVAEILIDVYNVQSVHI